MMPRTGKHVCQVAFTALDGEGLRSWYADVFGLVRSGKILFFPPSTTRVQGVPGAWEKTGWLLDQQDYFQLEFFRFLSPRTKLRPADWRPCDIGYNMVGIAVSDFDQVLRNVGAFSGIEPPPISGEVGERRAVVADPEGNLVEILECDPVTRIEGMNATVVRPEVPAVVRTMRAVVPSLAEAREDFVDAMGLAVVEDFQLHSAQDEAMWGLAGAEAETLVLRTDNFLLELVQYRSPESRPWPQGYRLSDQGFMNIALGYRDNLDYDASFAHATRSGMRPNGRVADIGVFRVMYVNDRNGFSVEMLNARRFLWWVSGFSSHEPYVECETRIRAPASEVWARLTDHAGLGDWSLFRGRVLREGSEQTNGVGCIRELTVPGMRITEEVTAWDEGAHYSYQLRTGAPFRRHQGDVFVTEENGLTRVRWAIRFDSWIPFTGRIVAWVLQRVFNSALKKLKGQLERGSFQESTMAAEKPFKKALITGGAGELANEICRNLAAMGTQIVAVDINREGLDTLADRFGDKVSVDTYELDMCDHEALEALLLEIAEKHPDIDVLFANAGIDVPQRAANLDWRIANRHFDVNTTANYVLFSVFLPRFIERGEGHVVAIISLGGLLGTPFEHAYNGSKSAMHRIVDGLRIELNGTGVSFTSVFPSFLEGSMIAGNAFKVEKATPMAVAGKRVVDAALSRQAHLKFPWLDAFKIFVLGLMPRALSDRVAASVMQSDFDS